MVKLVFVYNADSGFFNLLKDVLHKLLSPNTYPCSLCDLTYGILGEKRRWIQYRKNLSIPQEYLHRDEFQMQYNCSDSKFPAVYRLTYEGLILVLSRDQIDACDDIRALEVKVRELASG